MSETNQTRRVEYDDDDSSCLPRGRGACQDSTPADDSASNSAANVSTTTTTTGKNGKDQVMSDCDDDDDVDDDEKEEQDDDDDEYSYDSDSSDGTEQTEHGDRASAGPVTPRHASAAVAAAAAPSFTQGHRFWKMPQVRHFMQQSIREATDLLCIPAEATALLLRHYQWDGKKLMEDFFGGGSKRTQLLQACGVWEKCQAPKGLQSSQSSSAATAPARCPICLEDDLALVAMECGHGFCRDCWRAFLAQAVSQGPRCVYTSCPQPQCTAAVTERQVSAWAGAADASKFADYTVRNFVDTHAMLRWCPGPACQAVVGWSTGGAPSWRRQGGGDVRCPDCGVRFCPSCGDGRHVPATCRMLAAWKEKCRDESETANWMIVHTKKCPKCSSRIDKNGGCNRMACTHCNFQFCWMCMQDWKVHGYERSCFQSEFDRVPKLAARRDLAERELERYLHCFMRFQNHAQGQDFAQTELDKFGREQENLEKSDFSFDWQALHTALGQLVECRRVLKFTYVVTYNLVQRPLQRDLFQAHQALLERFTEMLSEITEKDYHKIDRKQLVSLTATVSRYAKNVMECDVYGDDVDNIATAGV